MNTSEQSSDDLANRLASIEHLLESPIVAGEMRVRFKNLSDEFKRLSQEFAVHLRSSHEPQYQQIEETDAAMLARVDQLKQDDQVIGTEIERVTRCFEDLTDAVQTVEQLPQNDEAELAEAVPPLIADALALVIRIRMQEKAVATWFVEAFQRDRGVAD